MSTQEALAHIQAALREAEARLLRGDLAPMCAALETALDALAGLARAGLAPRLHRPPPPWDARTAESMVWQLLARLKAEGCAAFAFAGTLLGLERNGRLLPGDKDADFAVWLEDFSLACRVLEALGLRRAVNVPPFGNMASLVHAASGHSVDLFGIRRDPAHGRLEGGVWLYGRPPSHQRVLHLPWFELAPRAGPAGEVWWPAPPGVLLTALYGDWRTRRPEWDSLVSCPSVLEFNLHWRCWALKSLCDRWLTGDLARTRRLWDQIAARTAPDARLLAWRDALDAAIATAAAGAPPGGAPQPQSRAAPDARLPQPRQAPAGTQSSPGTPPGALSRAPRPSTPPDARTDGPAPLRHAPSP